MQYTLFGNSSDLRKMLMSFFSSNIPLYVEKNTMGKSYKVLETKLKMYNAVSSNFDFEKIKFKVLHHIQEDFMARSQ